MTEIVSLADNLSFVPLMKTTVDENGDFRFAGIASDESPDMSPDRDSILRKHLDVEYAQKHGYVNWDHGRGPEDQLGALTKAVIIPQDQLKLYSARCGIELPDTASLYVEGILYKHQDRAQHVVKMLKSVQEGSVPFGKGPGLSIDGSAVRDNSGKMQKAIVRGVAITPSPAHTNTFCNLVKSILSECPGAVQEDLVKSTPNLALLSYPEAVYAVMQMKPTLSLQLAEQIVDYTIQQKENQ